jgi:hypothetical protein
MKPCVQLALSVVAAITLLLLGNLLLLGQMEPPAVLVWPGVAPVFFFLGLLLWLLYAGYVLATIRLVVELRRQAAVPLRLLACLTEAAQRGNAREARLLCRVDDSFLARVLAAGLARMSLGLDSAKEAAHQMTLTIKSEKERQLASLAMIAVLGPPIGMLAFYFFATGRLF